MPGDADGAVADPTKVAAVLAGVGGLATIVFNWLRGRRDSQEKTEMTMVEQYKTLVADLNKAAEAAKAEHSAYKADTGRQIQDLRDQVAELISQVHHLRLYLAQNGIKMPPKWDPDDDSALFRSLDGPKEAK